MSFIDWLSLPWGQEVEPTVSLPACDFPLLSIEDFMTTSSLPTNGLVFIIEKLQTGSSYESPTNQVGREEFFHTLHKAAAEGNEKLYGAISSKVENGYVMTLDCDGTDEMLAVCHILKSYYGLAYAVVVSSPGHYWVIVDKVDTTRNLLKMMEIMPGIDTRYVDCIRNKGNSVLRGMPKDSMPIFPDSVEFKNEQVKQWYHEFKDAWQSEEMKHILRLKQLFKAIKEKKVSTLATNPSFAV